MNQKIAVYNNTTGVVQRLQMLCRGEQIEVIAVRSRSKLMEYVTGREVQLILLDIAVENQGWGEGIRLISSIRSQCRMPIMVVSDQENENAKITALSVGADDYVNAGDNPLVLLARIKSQLRRYLQLSSLCSNVDRIYRVDGLEIDDTHRKVLVEGREVRLTPIEYQILKLLVMEKGRVFSISQIYEEIWKMEAIGAENIIAVHIRHIREKIEQNPRQPRYLKVVWGTGYMVG